MLCLRPTIEQLGKSSGCRGRLPAPKRECLTREQLLDHYMTIATLEQLKSYVRDLSKDLEDAFTLALESASAEVRNYLGFDPDAESGGQETDSSEEPQPALQSLM